MKKRIPKGPVRFINRELSWLEFNDRVLQQGESKALPLGERLKFLAIVSSNFDEFFMIRVAGLRQQHAAGLRKRDLSGLTPNQQLLAVSGKVYQLVQRQSQALAQVFQQLEKKNILISPRETWTPKQRDFLHRYFTTEIQPVLTPLAVEKLDPCPLLPGLQLLVAALVTPPEENAETSQLVMIPIPAMFPRFITIPAMEQTCFATLEDVISDHVVALFPGHTITATAVLRVTRDADVAIQEDEAGDLLSSISKAVLDRRRRAAVRLEISAKPHARIRSWLANNLDLRIIDIFEIEGLLDAKALWQLVSMPALQSLQDPNWPPIVPQDLLNVDNLWSAVQERDILLVHPYESFEPVINLLQQAANDPSVLAIKQTLYRTSGDSPIVQSLARAAENGKEVTVLVELQARFDEANNINWARRLEDAGCHVIYGIAGLKTHGKALLIVRREAKRIRRYVHLATGNYNDSTARLYSDIGLISCDDTLCRDVASFFNLLTGISEIVGWDTVTIAPTDLRRKILDLIEREIQVSTAESPGLILAKMNSLQDPEICEALYRASQAGVQIKLNIRGICCLRPHLEGLSENIEVTSIVDRFLEHARIFYFANSGHEEVYLTSADWMRRNLDRRLELMFPVRDQRQRKRLIRLLETYFADNTQTWVLRHDGQYERLVPTGKKLRSQQRLYEDSVKAMQKAPTRRRFQPLKRPK